MAETLKEINYRGGVIKFKIPSSWKEEYEENGGGIFYEDAPGTGTLRLNIITMQAPPNIQGNLPVQALASVSGTNEKDIEVLGNGNALAHTMQKTEEQGVKITLYWWYLANHVPPNHVRMANFSYTVLTSKEHDKNTKIEIQLLEKEIKSAVFHPELGE